MQSVYIRPAVYSYALPLFPWKFGRLESGDSNAVECIVNLEQVLFVICHDCSLVCCMPCMQNIAVRSASVYSVSNDQPDLHLSPEKTAVWLEYQSAVKCRQSTQAVEWAAAARQQLFVA